MESSSKYILRIRIVIQEREVLTVRINRKRPNLELQLFLILVIIVAQLADSINRTDEYATI